MPKRTRKRLGQKIETSKAESINRDIVSWCRAEERDPDGRKPETRACIIGGSLTVGKILEIGKIPPPVRSTIFEKSREALRACELATKHVDNGGFLGCDKGVRQAREMIQAEIDRQAVEERERQLIRRRQASPLGRRFR